MPLFDFGDGPVDELVDFDGQTLGEGVHCAVDLGERFQGYDYGFNIGEGLAFWVNGCGGDDFVD